MKHQCENTLLEKSAAFLTLREIVLPSPGNPGTPNPVKANPGDSITWIWHMPSSTPPFTVTISPPGPVAPLSYKAVFINGQWEASGGQAVLSGMCNSTYGGGAAATVPPNVIIVDNSTDDD